ncbi:hypothetical protein [Klebsiella aerogenes]|uniref:hypothetical protein n=1 Tax=Klebsiella aerogenes TaxID=548 RepID=UPI002FF52595
MFVSELTTIARWWYRRNACDRISRIPLCWRSSGRWKPKARLQSWHQAMLQSLTDKLNSTNMQRTASELKSSVFAIK